MIDIEFYKSTNPDLVKLSDKELRTKLLNSMYLVEVCIKLAQDRDMKDFWDYEKILKEIEWITEEFGWEGLGR